MGKKTKLGKTRLDKFYHLAKEQGYRSRASFKLVQLNKKYDLLSKSKVVLDLCAAPGSWSQVAVKYLPVQSIVIAVDLVPIKPIKNVICLQEDITTDKCKASIKAHLKTWKVDLVLNDGAPNVGGAWCKDAYSQAELSLLSLRLATHFLRAGGNFVTKVFRSSDYNALMWVFNQMFKRVEATKPHASRNESAEIFVVCLGYLAPKKIDPKLLDPKYVFEELDLNPAKKANVMQKQNPNQRHRDGYEVGVTVLYKEISAADFARCEDALDVLTNHNKIIIGDEGEDLRIAQHPKTTSEIRICCNDLRVLGKADFRSILRWRDAMRKELGVVSEEEVEKEKAEGEEEELDDETKATNEIELLNKKAVAREKRKKRKEREKRAKYQRRIDLKMVNPDDVLETGDEAGLFSVRRIKTQATLDDMEDGTEQADKLYESNEEDEDEEGSDDESDSELDNPELTPDERRRIITEREMDKLYTDYLTRTGQIKKRERKGKKLKKVADADAIFAEGEMIEGSFVPNVSCDPLIDSEDEDDDDAEADASHPLIDTLVEKPDTQGENEKADKKAAMLWFDQPIFKDLNWRSEAGSSEAATRAPKAQGPMPAPAAAKKRKAAGAAGSASGEGGKGKENAASKVEETDGFEEVKADSSGDDSDDSDYSDEDEHDEAELAALGSLLKKKKLRKEDLIDACYHRYAFNDTQQAPIWFQDAEKKYNKRLLPITKQQVEEQKARMMEIAARPIKKVAEAKARKKLKAVRAHQKFANKAEAVTNDSDMTEKAKQRALQKLYDKGVAVKRPRSVTVVAKKGSKGVSKKGVKIVDKRMKKDEKATERMGTRNYKRGAIGKKAAKERKKKHPPAKGGIKKK